MKKILFVMIGAVLLSSCGFLKKSKMATINPLGVTEYYTTPEMIYNLSRGMTIAEVNNTLKVEPTDFYLNAPDGYKVITYRYKLQYQDVPMKRKDRAIYLRGGQEHFKDEGTLYVFFNASNNQLMRYITDEGRDNAEKLMRNKHKIESND